MPVFRYWQLATAADVKKEGFAVKSGHGQMAGHCSARREGCPIPAGKLLCLCCQADVRHSFMLPDLANNGGLMIEEVA